jgi:uncharacterized repeat protein (TIGR03943 family)
VSRYGPCLLLVLVGAAVLRISLFSELYLRYVQAGLRPYLVVSGGVLVLLGSAMAVVRRGGREVGETGEVGEVGPYGHGQGLGHEHEDSRGHGHELGLGHEHEDSRGHGHELGLGHEHEDSRGHGHGHGLGHEHEDSRGHGHGHGHGLGHEHEHEHSPGHGHEHGHGAAGPRIAWLLTLPALALLLFPPPALGSYSAEREAAQRAAQGVGAFPALPAGDPVELTLGAFGSRAIYDSGHSLKGRTVRMTGFVTHGDDGTWYLTRLSLTCCAADATTSKVEVRGAADGAPPVDTWVTVTGTWHPEGELGTDSAWPPVVDASAVRRVRQPADPYEKR